MAAAANYVSATNNK